LLRERTIKSKKKKSKTKSRYITLPLDVFKVLSPLFTISVRLISKKYSKEG